MDTLLRLRGADSSGIVVWEGMIITEDSSCCAVDGEPGALVQYPWYEGRL
jgi:hypothetical protein